MDLLPALLILTSPFTASSIPDAVKVGNHNATTLYFVKGSIKRDSENRPRGWFAYELPNENGVTFVHRSLVVAHCSYDRITGLQITATESKNPTNVQMLDSGGMERIEPGTIGETMFNTLCAADG